MVDIVWRNREDKKEFLVYVDVQWNLVCDRSWLVLLTQSVYMVGRIVGTQLYGFLMDRSDFTHSLLCSLLCLYAAGRRYVGKP